MRLAKILMFFIIIVFLSQLTSAQILQSGEELVYDVSYSGISLGTVTIITEEDNSVDGIDTYKAKCMMKSHPGIPFVALNVIFESWIDKSLACSRKFVGNYEEKNGWSYQEIIFNYNKNTIFDKKYIGKEKVFSKQTLIKTKWNDGLSLFF